MATQKTEPTPESLDDVNQRAAEAGAAATTAEARSKAKGLAPVKSTPAD